MKNRVVAYLKDENGQTSTEYILLVAVVCIIIFKFKGKLESALGLGAGGGGLIGDIFSKISGLVKEMN